MFIVAEESTHLQGLYSQMKFIVSSRATRTLFTKRKAATKYIILYKQEKNQFTSLVLPNSTDEWLELSWLWLFCLRNFILDSKAVRLSSVLNACSLAAWIHESKGVNNKWTYCCCALCVDSAQNIYCSRRYQLCFCCIIMQKFNVDTVSLEIVWMERRFSKVV